MSETRPNLPALETVCVKAWQVPILLSMLICMTFFISGATIYGYLKYRVYFSDMLFLVQTAVGIILFLCLWVIFRLFTADYVWKTDSYGLHINGIFKRKSIMWADVADVIPVMTMTSGMIYKLKTSTKEITLAPLVRSHILTASVWQHLRRYDKASNIQLDDDILSLWAEIPDTVPTEMQWTNPRATILWVASIGLIFFLAVIICFIVVCIISGKVMMILLAILISPGWAVSIKMIYRESFLRASSVSMNDEYIDVKLPLRNIHLPWSNVTYAGWERISRGGDNHLQIKGMDSKSEVLIPHVIEDELSSRLILAIIWRLRTSGVPQALIIPAILRNQKTVPEHNSLSETVRKNGFVELRFLWWERLISTMPFIFLIGGPVALFLAHGSEFPPQSFAAIVLSFVAGFFLVGAYSMRVDDNGISKRFLWWSKTIRWSEVNSLVVVESRNNPRFLKRFLKDQDGKVLTSIVMEFGGKQNYEEFIAFMNTKLAEHLPEDKINSPWKAG